MTLIYEEGTDVKGTGIHQHERRRVRIIAAAVMFQQRKYGLWQRHRAEQQQRKLLELQAVQIKPSTSNIDMSPNQKLT